MKILLVDNHTKNLKKIVKLLSGFDCTVCKREQFSTEMADMYDLIIILGGSNVRSVKNHVEDYKNEIDFIKDTDKKIIGICLGCEIIAKAFGCNLKENKNVHKGIYTINYRNLKINVYESHRFQIETASDEIEIIATSDFGIEMIKHKTKPIYGMQFHPEVEVPGSSNILLEIIKEI